MDPASRIYKAISDNLELLSNNDRTKQFWFDNKSRFLHNVDIAQNKLSEFYIKRATSEFQEAIRYFNLE
jgi:hypothetical protein